MIVFTIYCHTCTVTGKKYVGQTRKTMKTRWTEHVSAAFSFVGCQALGRAIRKYGRDNWTHEVIEICTSQDDANIAEAKWIAQLNTIAPLGYNLDLGGVVPRHPDVGDKIRITRAAKSPEWQTNQNRLLREAHSKFLATTSTDERSVRAKAVWAIKTQEERSAIAQKRESAVTAESRAQRNTKISETIRSSTTPSERSDRARARIMSVSPEKRSERSKRAARTLGPEKRREIGSAGGNTLWANTTPEQRSEAWKQRRVKINKDQRTANFRATWAAKTREEIDEMVQKQSPESRKARAMKAWVTKRLKSALKSHDFTLIGRPEVPAAPNGG